MSLLRQHGTLITVDANAVIDTEAASGLPSNERAAIDLAVIGFANFMSGTYQQNTSDPQDITSTVSINTEQVKKASFALLTALPSDSGAGFSTYGGDVKDTGDKLVIQGRATLITDDDESTATVTSSSAWFANLRVWQGDINNVTNGTNIKHSQGIGAVLVQAAGAALFKSLGKNAAINNENSIEGKQSKLSNDLTNAIQENTSNYSESTMFKRYLDSGRYYDDNADINVSQNYNFKNANLDFVVQLQGTLSDSDDVLSNAIVTRVLGTPGTDHKVALANKEYKMNIFVRLQQRDDL